MSKNNGNSDLSQYIGKAFMHTPKAVKRGEPHDRLFLVVDIVEDEGRPYLLAWKTTLVRTGMVDHPGFLGLIGQWEIVEYPDRYFTKVKSKVTGSTPTAMFIPDSLYKLVTLPVEPPVRLLGTPFEQFTIEEE